MPGRVVRRLGRMLGRRGAILLCYGAVWALYGYAQIASPPPDQRGLQPLLELMPLDVWGGLWMAAGLLAVVAAWLPQGMDWPAYPALQLVVLPWMGCYFATWLMGDFPRGWIAAAVWGLISVPVWVAAGWPEPPRVKRVSAV
ncbi:hypothetical protein PV733_31360 [Streptomyces europaeiscabiei]|uniref:hypothetical protein n=1 Tax=Streptomyces europaeiscabiei TaxID=146819 RepID=UPI0029ABE1FD|nr:hypothetical protein [Streptomyces europaeiscabiei]MDX3713361.1 hypothetical protein [Streptomyces europaeiscabiei]